MTATFYVGDAIEVMNKLPAASVDLVLSSPPFLALRSYLPADHVDKAKEGGSQATPGEYIDWLVDVAEACARVLAPHGSLCFELGDTYAGTNPSDVERPEHMLGARGRAGNLKTGGADWPLAKSLSLIPELFRLTLVYGHNPLTGRQTDRWRLRNVIRWVRPNPPVGALGDKFRPATSELMVFCKSAKRYFDLDAVRTDYKPQSGAATHPPRGDAKLLMGRRPGNTTNERSYLDGPGAPPLDWWELSEGQVSEGEKFWWCDKYDEQYPVANPICVANEDGRHTKCGWRLLIPVPEPPSSGAPPLDWWNIPPGGYEGAHYAVMPAALCVKPIKAMCPEQVCRTCGEPQRRIVELETVGDYANRPGWRDHRVAKAGGNQSLAGPGGNTRTESHTLGFSDCGHDNYRPGLVLDPFAGSGTTLAVATGHGREAIGIDLDERNYALALERVGPMFLRRGFV